MAQLWYPGRQALDWRRKSIEETQTVFDAAGLTGEFWRVAAL